jgi:formylglycine-generating enzyme required for sulfatase activity
MPGAVATWHRLVVLAPFFLDRTEVTGTRAFAGGIAANGVDGWSGSTAGTSPFDWCTGQVPAGARSPLPLNCVLQSAARGFCQKAGGDLPTEAELEYVMGGLQMTPYVWGADLPHCADAVWGRNGFGLLDDVVPQDCLIDSMALGAQGGPELPGSGGRDSLALPGGPILDLTGNLAELARDDYQTQTEPCWSVAGVLHDPVCTTPSPSLGAQITSRGGSWSAGGTFLEADWRQYGASGTVSPSIGFRCMKPAE